MHHNKYEKNKNYFLNNSEFIDNNIFSNKEEIIDFKKENDNFIIENISINSHKNNSLNEKNIKFDESLSVIKKIDNQENDDTVNIYDNNNSLFNKTNKLDDIKIKEEEKENNNNNSNINININNELNISTKNNKSIIQIKIKNKNKNGSMILNNNNYNKDFDIKSNIKYNKNSSICIPHSKLKLDISKNIFKKKENNSIIIDDISEKVNKINKINNVNKVDKISNFSNYSKKIKYSNSFKLVNYVKMEKLGKTNEYKIKTGRVSKNKNEKKILKKYNFNCPIINSKNTLNNIENNKVDKEKTISVISNNTNKNININQNIVNEISPNDIDNNLNYINNENYFDNHSKKDINESKTEEKFIIENADSKIEEPKDNNSNINKENKEIINNNKNKEEEKIKEAEENIKDFEGEIEDEQDDLEEENKKINDSKSIISNYVVAPLINIQDIRSYAPSLYSKSEYKDNISNINDLTSNKGLGLFIPPGIETEIEIMNENGKELKSFIETPRASGTYNKRFTHKNVNYNTTTTTHNNIKYCNSCNKSLNQQMKNIINKINWNTNEIQKINEKIVKIEEKIKNYEENNKKYELWIGKEEEESELLINMLNFLNINRK